LRKNHAKLFDSISGLLENREFFKDYLFEPQKHFKRERQLPFRTVVLLILRLLKSSVKTELKKFHTEVFKTDEVVNWVSGAAFSKARQKINYSFFSGMSRMMSDAFYACHNWQKWNGFRLMGVDGSQLNLPSAKELLKDFGHHHTNSIGTAIPQARLSFLTDVLNKVTLDASMESFTQSEQAMLLGHLDVLGDGDLLTADSNYGHFWVMKKVLGTGADFCFRISRSSNFIKGFLESGKTDEVVQWQPSAKTRESCRKNNVDTQALTVRIVRIELENEVEVLVSSLTDMQKYTYQDMKQLYAARWASEEEYKKFMQRLMVEFFSSLKTNGVRQDFHANVFMLNLVSFLSFQGNREVFQSSKEFKYRRQINWTSAFADVRSRFVLLVVRGTQKVSKILDSLHKSFMNNTEAIKPERKFKRDKRKKGARKKAFICYKPAW